MDYAEFHKRYHATIAAMQETHVTTLAAAAVLFNFPDGLPEPTRTTLTEAFQQMRERLFITEDEAEANAEPATKGKSLKFDFADDPLAGPIFGMLMLRMFAGVKNIRDVDVLPALFAQELITILAHLDGFSSDVVRAACECDPRLLKRGKQITWEAALATGSWDSLISQLTDDYVFEFSWKSWQQRFRHLVDDVGLDLAPEPEMLEVLDEAYQMRHIIVHASGRATREYLARTRRTDVAVGARLPVDARYISRVHPSAAIVCAEMFRSTATKFFGATKEDLRHSIQWKKQSKRTRKKK